MSEVSAEARPRRKAGTDRSNTVDTTVAERIPEGFHSVKPGRIALGGTRAKPEGINAFYIGWSASTDGLPDLWRDPPGLFLPKLGSPHNFESTKITQRTGLYV